jgi:hypothetical protein
VQVQSLLDMEMILANAFFLAATTNRPRMLNLDRQQASAGCFDELDLRYIFPFRFFLVELFH